MEICSSSTAKDNNTIMFLKQFSFILKHRKIMLHEFFTCYPTCAGPWLYIKHDINSIQKFYHETVTQNKVNYALLEGRNNCSGAGPLSFREV